MALENRSKPLQVVYMLLALAAALGVLLYLAAKGF